MRADPPNPSDESPAVSPDRRSDPQPGARDAYYLVRIAAEVAEQLHRSLQMEEPWGTVDISFYRDDFSKIGTHPQVHGSYLPIEIDDRHIIIVDDVLHTGRTARAALNELFAWGRPASVVLAVLLDRGNREVPLHAEVVGHHMSLGNDDFVKISADGRAFYSNFSSS